MIDVLRDQLLGITAAARLLPGRPHCGTIMRWVQKGLGGERLEAVKVGGKWYTTREALNDFIARTTASAGGQTASTRHQPQQAVRLAAADVAGAKLDAIWSARGSSGSKRNVGR
jgi:hypothetical protein